MRNIFGSWYADWRDEHGHRHMKAFPSKKAAAAYTRRMQRAVAGKKARPSAQSRPSPKPGPKQRRQGPHESRPAKSPASAAR